MLEKKGRKNLITDETIRKVTHFIQLFQKRKKNGWKEN